MKRHLEYGSQSGTILIVLEKYLVKVLKPQAFS